MGTAEERRLLELDEAIEACDAAIEYKNEVKVLGLTIKRTGCVQHITNRINLAKRATAKLKRFRKLSWNIKIILCIEEYKKPLIRPGCI